MARLYNTHPIITEGLSLYLDAANPVSYSGSGTTWTDLSHTKRNGTLQNGVEYQNKSLLFDGTNQYVNLNFPFIQENSSNQYTLFVGAKLFTTSPDRRLLWGSDNGGFDWGFGYGSDGNGRKFVIYDGGNFPVYSNTVQDTNWHILTAQWSSTGTKIFVDGVLDISNNYIEYDNSISSTTSIGRNPSGSEYFQGNISFVQLYDRILNEEEITQNFQALRERFNI